jgi:hypothetical protein
MSETDVFPSSITLPVNTIGRDIVVGSITPDLSDLNDLLAEVVFSPSEDRLFILGGVISSLSSDEVSELVTSDYVYCTLNKEDKSIPVPQHLTLLSKTNRLADEFEFSSGQADFLIASEFPDRLSSSTSQADSLHPFDVVMSCFALTDYVFKGGECLLPPGPTVAAILGSEIEFKSVTNYE